MNIGSEQKLQEKAAKQIFVRDIYKNFCIEGINAEFNSHYKVAEKLKMLTQGYKVVTVGSSAGGFMAILFGCLLNAEAIYAFPHRYRWKSITNIIQLDISINIVLSSSIWI